MQKMALWTCDAETRKKPLVEWIIKYTTYLISTMEDLSLPAPSLV